MSEHLLKTLAYKILAKDAKTLSFDLIVPWSRVKGAIRGVNGDVSILADGFTEMYVTMPFEEFERQFEAYLVRGASKK